VCIPAPTCRAALDQATKKWPGRNRLSDGICGDARHQRRTSDHNEGNAFDLTHDPAHGLDTYMLAELMRRKPDPRVKYIISNGRIWNPSISPEWRTYTGDNPHTKHMHVSIKSTARNQVGDWWNQYDVEPRSSSPREDLLMAIALNDDDARRCLVRDWCTEHWGYGEMTLDEQNILTYHFGTKGADLTLAAIIDHKKASAFRDRRGW
jgi:hypothetical protein